MQRSWSSVLSAIPASVIVFIVGLLIVGMLLLAANGIPSQSTTRPTPVTPVTPTAVATITTGSG